ncbi:MAG: NADPH-dependent glutamate synthase [Erysipelotrichaceae bacterium]|nr:NADPH-dependent glutamate synthase [Erysipelotrichaceae bacterium]
MPNMSLEKNKMPMLEANDRIHSFDEVALGYSEEVAVLEANRCLHCPNHPCVEGCPVNIDIPNFIEHIKNKDYESAYRVISLNSSLPAICGRVCPQESQCESKCVRGIKGEPVGIGRLERFVADNHVDEEINKPVSNGHKVAIVGSGPSGLACAYELSKDGYDVTIYEALHVAGGVLMYGIPEFRLPKKIVQKEIDRLVKLGVKINTNVVVGKSISIDELLQEYEALYLGTGAGLPNFMDIDGEMLNGVYSANEFLTRTNLMKAYKDSSSTPIMKGDNVAVVGGGNVAMDAARSALRLDAKRVYIIYRRSMEELPARKEEVEHSIEEGIDFKLLNNPVEIIGENGHVKAIKCIKMQLGEPDERGRRKPYPIEGSEFELDVDVVIMAIGTSPNPLLKNSCEKLNVSSRGGIIIDDSGMTSIDNVFAGGDAVTGSATVISAMSAGKNAAKEIKKRLSNLVI